MPPDETLPPCPQCHSPDSYSDGSRLVCPLCAHEWSPRAAPQDEPSPEPNQQPVVRDANGNALVTGDSVIVIKDLKVRGSSLVVKGGTKVRNIRLVDGDHNIDCRVDGIGPMQLKSEFVRKA